MSRDVLSEKKLCDLLVLWENRLEIADNEAYANKCRKMIRMYTLRLSRLEGNENAVPDPAAV